MRDTQWHIYAYASISLFFTLFSILSFRGQICHNNSLRNSLILYIFVSTFHSFLEIAVKISGKKPFSSKIWVKEKADPRRDPKGVLMSKESNFCLFGVVQKSLQRPPSRSHRNGSAYEVWVKKKKESLQRDTGSQGGYRFVLSVGGKRGRREKDEQRGDMCVFLFETLCVNWFIHLEEVEWMREDEIEKWRKADRSGCNYYRLLSCTRDRCFIPKTWFY